MRIKSPFTSKVNREPFWPRINRLLGGSIIFHIIVVACVLFIPPVRDALSIAAMFSDAGFVDRGYSKTHIANDAELLTMTTDQFRYPEGYWLIDQGIEIPPLAAPTPTPVPVFQPPIIRHRGTEELASAIESVGGSMDSYGGNDSFGVNVEVKTGDRDHSRTIAIEGPAKLRARDVSIPGDVSSAGYFLAAAALLPGRAAFARHRCRQHGRLAGSPNASGGLGFA